MELKHLRSFVLVAETASLSVAAYRCHITQSAVSQHIRSLDEERKLAEQYGIPYGEEVNDAQE